jgi:tetratricopeptide (TPR) repeat protein
MLNELGALLFQVGDVAGARSCIEETLGIRQRIFGAGHPETATAVNNLGALLQKAGDLTGARSCYEQALSICRKTLGPDHPNTARTINNLGTLLLAMHDPRGARLYLEHSLALHRRLFGSTLETAEVLHNLIWALRYLGDYRGVLSYIEEAAGIYQGSLGPDHPGTAASLKNLGDALLAMGDYAGAQTRLERARSVFQRALGPKHPAVADVLDSLGQVLQQSGDYSAARNCHEEALTIRRETFGSDHPVTAGSLNSLGWLLHELGMLAEARDCVEEALAISRKTLGPADLNTGGCLNNLGRLLQDLGDYAGARSCFEQGLDICQKVLGGEHAQTAISLNNLGVLLEVMGEYVAARPVAEQALEIWTKSYGPDHAHTGLGHNNLGIVLHHLGELVRAREHYEQALAIRRKALGQEHPETASTLSNLASLAKTMEDFASADALYEQALAIYQKSLGPQHPHTAQVVQSIAQLKVALGHEAQALALMQQAAAADDWLIGQVFSSTSDRERLSFLGIVRWRFEMFLSLVCDYPRVGEHALRAAFDLVLRRKAIAAEAAAVQRDAVWGGKYPALQAQLEQLARLRMQIARKSLAGAGPEGPQAHQEQLNEWQIDKDRLEAQLCRQIPEMNLEEKLRQADRRAIAQSLPEGASLVEFVRFHCFDFKALPARGERQWRPAHYLAFIMLAGESEGIGMIDLGEAEPIDRLIAEFRNSVSRAPEGRTDRDLSICEPEQFPGESRNAGSRLRAAVFDPLCSALGKHRGVLLAPDGDLTLVPFEILPVADAEVLADKYQISYLGTSRDLLRFKSEFSDKAGEALVVCDPDFDLAGVQVTGQSESNPPSKDISQPVATTQQPASNLGRLSRDFDRSRYYFRRLAGTRAEGERIADLLGVQPWIEGAALEGRLKQQCRSPRVLHLATHGFFLRDQPEDPMQWGGDLNLRSSSVMEKTLLSGPLPENPLLRSGLALAGANTWLRQGILAPEAEDGLLTAEDVSGLELLATDLVVLSACESGLGEVRTGEGVFGLQRAFVLAGAKTLVMSLWNVPDEVTCELMAAFYERLLQGRPKANALREAQRQVRNQYPDPYYWGAFVCLGDPSALRFRDEG